MKNAGQGVMHIRTGRIDGWYFGGSAERMLGWFRAAFPRDEFRLVVCDGWLGDERVLRPSQHALWASSNPDWAAADRFEDGLEVVR